ncbi:MAG TPA: hypothetical protein VJQ55_18295 [Candidatus Binatia bacterium]|nr:hypothetical protein [Candidatus Binatia bacterium]
MDVSSKADIDSICRELAQSFQGILTWKWDRRFETVLAEFKVTEQDKVRAILERYLSATWDSSNVGDSPDIVRTVEGHFGGLWPGQLLFTSDPKRDALVFGTWWPWGDGKEISIRIGPAFRVLAESKRDEKIARFKACFGV